MNTIYLKRAILLVFIFLVLGGCTRFTHKLFYNHLLVRYIISRVDNLFDLRPRQKAFLTNRLEDVKEWHRKYELPLYAIDLGIITKKFEDNSFQMKDLEWMMKRARVHRDSIYRKIMKTAVEFLFTLEKGQVEYLSIRLTEQNKEFRQELKKSKEKRYHELADQYISNFENFTSDFSRAQKKIILSKVKALPDTQAAWLEYREFRQKEFIEFLNSTPTSGE